jgi:hypothetical protein
VDYYCFNRYRIEAEESFTFFSDNPEQDFDILLIAFKKLLFYQHHDILNRTIKNIYDTINNSYKLVEGAGLDLALYKFDINLEYYFDKAEHKGFNRNEFAKSLLPYGFKLQETTLSAIENGLFNFELSPEHLIDSFKKQRIVFYQTIQCLFQREMADKHFNFVLSGTLWNKMLNFWDEQNNKQKSKPDEFFAVHADKFEKYLAKLAGDFFIDNKSEMIAVLWGSVYIYDFLLSKGMICQETFNSFKNTSRILKGKVIGQYTDILWNSDFIHQWEKPDSISEIEFQEEGKIFQKSFLIKPDKFSKLQSSIAEELEKIGELSCFIIKGGAND